MASDHAAADFAGTLGREFRRVLAGVVGDDTSAHDFYSAVADALGPPISPDRLKQLSPAEFERLREGMQRYFEVSEISEQQVQAAIHRTLHVGGY